VGWTSTAGGNPAMSRWLRFWDNCRTKQTDRSADQQYWCHGRCAAIQLMTSTIHAAGWRGQQHF